MVLASAFFFYFFCLVMFSLISHPVYYCVLLVLNSLICSFICYGVYGFSWYSILFCLVYIGGVYILFVFVSVHSPNSSVVSYWNFSLIFSFLFIFFSIMAGVLVYYLSLNAEFSSFLCNISEGPLYLVMCLTLLFGFFVLSLVMSVKLNHYR
uniref:NADH dehydrogenase subunit 6 n=3 Tax=unclassified Acanthobothrium TaxID=2666008 RepID=A0A8K1W784_9CEST|nr:NADH dehydrogenase subunit 6 [Acanthobothrium sp. MZUSP 8033]UFQ89011.1 NADH dehydrogenase subunit 6 [Acanthobothrium sp. MZUSP 8034]UFQ89023.1 NADH dehydrogenase subunit 6 [Acanthobothrium sp. MZUSP 8035]